MNALVWILVARRFGAEAFGDLGFAVAIMSYGLLLVQQGIDPVLVRECAAEPRRMRPYAGVVVPLRLVIAGTLVASTLIWSLVWGAGASRILLPCLGMSYFASAVSSRWCFLASENPRPVALAGIASQALPLAAAMVASAETGPVAVAAALAGGELLSAAWLWRKANQAYGIRAWGGAPREWMGLLGKSWPLFAGAGLGSALYNFDVIALRAFGRASEAALYLGAYRFITVFEPVLTAFQWSILPGLARAAQSGASTGMPLRRLASLPVLAAVAVAAILFWRAEALLHLVLGAGFAGAERILQVLAILLPLKVVRAVGRQALLASGRQKADLISQIFGVSTNVGLDLLLIPRAGALGCAFSALTSEVVYGAWVWGALRRVSRWRR
jgi:PST family polysaccharide transporter